MPPPPSPGKCESCYTLGRSLLLSKNAGGLLRYFAPSPWKLHSLLKVTMTGKKLLHRLALVEGGVSQNTLQRCGTFDCDLVTILN